MKYVSRQRTHEEVHVNNEKEFLFELTAPFGTTLLTVRNIPHLTASAVRPLLPGEKPHARLPATELSAAQTQTLYRTMTIGEHRKRLYEAIKDGTIEVLHHITYLPLKDLSSPAYVDWQLVSLPEFIRFANTLKIRVLNDAPIDNMQATPVPAVAQEYPALPVAAGASDGVKPEKSGPPPLTTGDIAFCFAGLYWKTESKWKKPLGDKPKWLAACIEIPGLQGVSETRWNPVLIGAALVRDGHAKQNSIRAIFQTKPQLAPWFDAWKTYEADNIAT